MTDCHRKGYERGLWFEIKCLQEIVASKEKKGVDASFERELVKSYKTYLKTRGASKNEIVSDM